jgi:hypothetical protein
LTAGATGPLRTLAFGPLGAGPWAAAWSGPEFSLLLGGVPPGSAIADAAVALEGEGTSEDWKLRGDGLELMIAPQAEPVRFVQDGDFEQLCRVSGHVTVFGHEHPVSCLGRRATRSALDIAGCESIRDVAAWFEPDDGIGLIAFRPRRSRGQDRDLITAAVLDPAGAAVVDDPRLSTTYDEHGAPVRAGMELWMDGDESAQYPRRAAGEAVGAGVEVDVEGLTIRAELLRWHSRGREGAGVYLLARRR